MNEARDLHHARRGISAALSAYFSELRRELHWKDFAMAFLFIFAASVGCAVFVNVAAFAIESLTGVRLD